MTFPLERTLGVNPRENLQIFQKNSADEIKFFDQLNAAANSFKEFDRVPEDKKMFKDQLEVAYGALSRLYSSNAQFFFKPENLREISRLFYFLGRSEYPGQMEKSRYYLQAALILKLNALSLSKIDVLKILLAHPSITALQDNLSKENPHDRSPLTDLPEKLIPEQYNAILDTENKPFLFELSCNLRWLGHTAQNIDALNKDPQRFDSIYGLAKECNENIIKRGDQQLQMDASWEMVELLYNTERFMLELTEKELGPKELALKKIKSLDHVKPYLSKEGDTLRTKTKLAQIENIQAIEKSRIAEGDLQLLLECYQHSCEALKIAKLTPNFDPGLLNMFKSNNVTFAVLANKIDLKNLSDQVAEVINYSKENEHYYNPTYFITAARFFCIQNKKDKALELLDTADKLANNSSENSKESLAASKKLRNEILGIKEDQ